MLSEDGAARCVALIWILPVILFVRLDAVHFSKRLLLNVIYKC